MKKTKKSATFPLSSILHGVVGEACIWRVRGIFYHITEEVKKFHNKQFYTALTANIAISQISLLTPTFISKKHAFRCIIPICGPYDMGHYGQMLVDFFWPEGRFMIRSWRTCCVWPYWHQSGRKSQLSPTSVWLPGRELWSYTQN